MGLGRGGVKWFGMSEKIVGIACEGPWRRFAFAIGVDENGRAGVPKSGDAARCARPVINGRCGRIKISRRAKQRSRRGRRELFGFFGVDWIITPLLADRCSMTVLLASQAKLAVVMRPDLVGHGPRRVCTRPVVSRADVPGTLRSFSGWKTVRLLCRQVSGS